MKQQINLTKKAVGGGLLRLTTDGQHITNGHWACRLDIVKQAALLTNVDAAKAMFPKAASVEEITPGQMDQIVPGEHAKVKFVRTHWIQTGGCGHSDYDAVLFIAEERPTRSGLQEKDLDKGPTQLWIDRRYVNLFGLEEVYSYSHPGDISLDPGCVRDDEGVWQILVMPKRLPYQKGLE